VVTRIDEGAPLVVHSGEQLTLRATFMPDSAEIYAVLDGGASGPPMRMIKETLSVSWVSTAGTFTAAGSGADVPDTILHLAPPHKDSPLRLPPSGSAIDLWAVARDERGGTDYLHTTLQFE